MASPRCAGFASCLVARKGDCIHGKPHSIRAPRRLQQLQNDKHMKIEPTKRATAVRLELTRIAPIDFESIALTARPSCLSAACCPSHNTNLHCQHTFRRELLPRNQRHLHHMRHLLAHSRMTSIAHGVAAVCRLCFLSGSSQRRLHPW